MFPSQSGCMALRWGCPLHSPPIYALVLGRGRALNMYAAAMSFLVQRQRATCPQLRPQDQGSPHHCVNAFNGNHCLASPVPIQVWHSLPSPVPAQCPASPMPAQPATFPVQGTWPHTCPNTSSLAPTVLGPGLGAALTAVFPAL